MDGYITRGPQEILKIILVNLIHFMHNPHVTEHPNQWAIDEKRFYVRTDY